jgi:predicted NBD/HSP70 family sugar kinase
MIRIGVDFGGTKIEAAALDAQGGSRRACGSDAAGLRRAAGGHARGRGRGRAAGGATVGRVGVGGRVAEPATGLMRNSNSTVLNGQPVPARPGRGAGPPVRYANDANCLALSEATDGAAARRGVVFAVILGTGCGGGVAVDARSSRPQPDRRRVGPYAAAVAAGGRISGWEVLVRPARLPGAVAERHGIRPPHRPDRRGRGRRRG